MNVVVVSSSKVKATNVNTMARKKAGVIEGVEELVDVGFEIFQGEGMSWIFALVFTFGGFISVTGFVMSAQEIFWMCLAYPCLWLIFILNLRLRKRVDVRVRIKVLVRKGIREYYVLTEYTDRCF